MDAPIHYKTRTRPGKTEIIIDGDVAVTLHHPGRNFPTGEEIHQAVTDYSIQVEREMAILMRRLDHPPCLTETEARKKDRTS